MPAEQSEYAKECASVCEWCSKGIEVVYPGFGNGKPYHCVHETEYEPGEPFERCTAPPLADYAQSQALARQEAERERDSFKKQRDEYLRYIQTDANVQINDVEDALLDPGGLEDFETLAEGVKLLCQERDRLASELGAAKDRERRLREALERIVVCDPMPPGLPPGALHRSIVLAREALAVTAPATPATPAEGKEQIK